MTMLVACRVRRPATAAQLRLAALGRAAEAELRQNILPFWLGLRDAAGGGFVGAAKHDGQAMPSAPKGVVMHARILWTFSTAYRRFGDPALIDAARAAFRFIADRLVDPAAGGVFWTVAADGAPGDPRKHLYGQAFAIYGLAAHHGATGDHAALDLARRLWRTIEDSAADPRGVGYGEAFSQGWRPAPNGFMGRRGAPRTFNCHFHLLEAFAALWDVWPDPALRRRIEMLLALMTGPALDRRGHTFRQFFTADWQPLDDGLSNGHDIEASWLLPAIADRLSPDLAATTRAALSGIAAAVLARAVEADGGVLNGPADAAKAWWVQAEAVVGFLDAFEHTGEMRFLDAAEQTWRFIDRCVVDREGGEWRRSVPPDGVGPMPAPKADIWKCPYHNGRACLEVAARAARLAGEAEAP